MGQYQLLTNHYRSFDLGLYNISGDFASNEQIKKCKNEIRFKNILPRSIRKKFNLGKFIYLKTNRVCERQINRYEPELLSKDGDVYYDGVFQTEKYFKPLRIVRLGGGLGNQMFQYAFGLAAGDVLWDNTSF